MTTMTMPLEEGEESELDSGIVVRRTADDEIVIRGEDAWEYRKTVYLQVPSDEIRQMAELAGYEVRER